MDYYTRKRRAFELIDKLRAQNLTVLEITSAVQLEFGGSKKWVTERLNTLAGVD